jgi:hypothetical protein
MRNLYRWHLDGFLLIMRSMAENSGKMLALQPSIQTCRTGSVALFIAACLVIEEEIAFIAGSDS